MSRDTTHFDRIVLMLDGDDAGRQGGVSVGQMLGERMSVSTIALDDSCQPDQLTSRAIHQLVHDHAITPTVETP